MIFAGNPGTGKTDIARLVAKAMYFVGVTKSARIVETDSNTLGTIRKPGRQRHAEGEDNGKSSETYLKPPHQEDITARLQL